MNVTDRSDILARRKSIYEVNTTLVPEVVCVRHFGL